MNLKNSVSTLMTKEVLTLSPDDNLQTARDVFGSKNIHHIPVVDEGELVGILSKIDFLYFLNPASKDNTIGRRSNEMTLLHNTVKEAMTSRVETIQMNDSLEKALYVLTENRFHALPVVEDKKLVGILTTHDILFRLLHPAMVK